MENSPRTNFIAHSIRAAEATALEMPLIRTNWIVLTGRPSCGKTTILNELKKQGFPTSPEIAREILECAAGFGISSDELLLQRPEITQQTISAYTFAHELALDPEAPYILDRSLTDSVAFLEAYGFPTPGNISSAVNVFSYKHALILPALPLVNDGFRPLNEEFYARVETQLGKQYNSRGIPCTYVNCKPGEERVDAVLRLIQNIRDSSSSDY